MYAEKCENIHPPLPTSRTIAASRCKGGRLAPGPCVRRVRSSGKPRHQRAWTPAAAPPRAAAGGASGRQPAWDCPGDEPGAREGPDPLPPVVGRDDAQGGEPGATQALRRRLLKVPAEEPEARIRSREPVARSPCGTPKIKLRSLWRKPGSTTVPGGPHGLRASQLPSAPAPEDHQPCPKNPSGPSGHLPIPWGGEARRFPPHLWGGGGEADGGVRLAPPPQSRLKHSPSP